MGLKGSIIDMRKVLLVILLAFHATVFTNANASSHSDSVFKEGVHYETLHGLTAYTQPTVTSFFSVYCGACYQWDKGPLIKLKTWLDKKDIQFKQVHVSFMGQYAKEVTVALAMTQGSPRYDVVKREVFNRIHLQGKDFESDREFFKTLEKAGLKQSEYDANKNNLMVMSTVLSWDQYNQYIQAVPGFLVNNRYLINISSIKSYDQLNSLILHLAEKPPGN